jgi:hypothetical protein
VGLVRPYINGIRPAYLEPGIVIQRKRSSEVEERRASCVARKIAFWFSPLQLVLVARQRIVSEARPSSLIANAPRAFSYSSLQNFFSTDFNNCISSQAQRSARKHILTSRLREIAGPKASSALNEPLPWWRQFGTFKYLYLSKDDLVE